MATGARTSTYNGELTSRCVMNTPTDTLIHLIHLDTPSLITRSVVYTSWTLISVYSDSSYLSLCMTAGTLVG